MSKIRPFLTAKFRNFRLKNGKKGDVIPVSIRLLTRWNAQKRPKKSILEVLWGGVAVKFWILDL